MRGDIELRPFPVVRGRLIGDDRPEEGSGLMTTADKADLSPPPMTLSLLMIGNIVIGAGVLELHVLSLHDILYTDIFILFLKIFIICKCL